MYKEVIDIIKQCQVSNGIFVPNSIYKANLSKKEMADIVEIVMKSLSPYTSTETEEFLGKVKRSVEEIINARFKQHSPFIGKIHQVNMYLARSGVESTPSQTATECLSNLIQITFFDTIDVFVNQFIKEWSDLDDKESLEWLDKASAWTAGKPPKVTAFYKAYLIATEFYPIIAQQIATNFAIEKNTNERNQAILNNSYDVILAEVLSIAGDSQATKQVKAMIDKEKAAHLDIFTNPKKFAKLKSNNHYMSFLYNCKVCGLADSYSVFIFSEFVSAFISGCLQWVKIQNQPYRLTAIERDLAVLEKYNTHMENEDNIQSLKLEKQLLSTPKALQRLLPFKELANVLNIDRNQMASYMTSTMAVSRQTIYKNFDSLVTQPMDICVVIN